MTKFSVTVQDVLSFALLFPAFSILLWYIERRQFFERASRFYSRLSIGDGKGYLKRIRDLANLCPRAYWYLVAPRLYVCRTDAQVAKTILLSPKAFDKGSTYHFVRPLFGSGLGTAAAFNWKQQRKLIQPTFNAKILNPFVGIFYSQSMILATKIEGHLNGSEIEIFDLLALASLDMLCETIMGVQIGAQTNNNLCYVEALGRMGENVFERIIKIWLHPDWIFNRTKLGKDQQRLARIIQEFTTDVIRKRETELLKESGQDTPDGEDDECGSNTRGKVFLDYLLNLSRTSGKCSDEELRDQVTTMIIAGHHTTAITNSFAMLMLACHPDIQEKVYQELCEVHGNDDVDEPDLTHEDLAHMDYLERVIKETMRLFPVLPTITRGITEDLDLGDHILPKGSEALIHVLKIHRNAKYWPDPLKFDPDRFLPENVSKRDPYCYLPFSIGPRNCIGWKHGLMSMKTLMATILRRYILKKDHIVPVEDIRLKMEVVLKPVHPITIRFEERSPRN